MAGDDRWIVTHVIKSNQVVRCVGIDVQLKLKSGSNDSNRKCQKQEAELHVNVTIVSTHVKERTIIELRKYKSNLSDWLK